MNNQGLLGNAAYYMQRSGQQPGGLLPAGPASFQGGGGGRMLSAPSGVQQLPSKYGNLGKGMEALGAGIESFATAYKAKQEAEKTKAEWQSLFTPAQTEGGPTVQNAATAPIFSMVPGMTPEKAQFLQMVGPEKGMPWVKEQVLKTAKEKEGFTLGLDQVRYDAKGNIIATGPQRPKGSEAFTLGAGQTRFDAAGNPIASVAPESKPVADTTDIRNYQFAVSQGEKRPFSQWQEDLRRAGADNGGLPAPDPGYMWTTDQATKQPIQVPKPGGKIEAEQAAAGARSEKAQQATRERATNVVANIDRALTSLERFPWMKTGFIGSLTSDIGGMPAADLDNLLKPVRAALAFGELQKMREASPTGGALGSIAVAELDLLQNSLYSLEQSQSSEQLIENLKKVKTSFERYTKALEGNVSAFGIKYPDGKSIDAAFATPEGQAELKSFIKEMTKEEILALPPAVQAALNANIQRGQK